MYTQKAIYKSFLLCSFHPAQMFMGGLWIFRFQRNWLWCSISVQLLSHVWLFVTPWTAAHQASLSITNFWNLFKLMSIRSVMPSNHLIFCCPLLLLPSIFPSIRVFSNESVLRITWPKYWSFSFSISRSNEYSGLTSFRMDWLDLLAVQGTLKSLLQHHSSKASILQRSAFFMVQLSHPYVTTGKTIALTGRTFVDKVMSLLFNMLSRLVIAFLPVSEHLLISWLPQGCTVVSWLLLPCLCIPSLRWLTAIWTCPLDLREGLGGWSLFSRNKQWGTQRGLCAQIHHRGACSQVAPVIGGLGVDEIVCHL